MEATDGNMKSDTLILTRKIDAHKNRSRKERFEILTLRFTFFEIVESYSLSGVPSLFHPFNINCRHWTIMKGVMVVK